MNEWRRVIEARKVSGTEEGTRERKVEEVGGEQK